MFVQPSIALTIRHQLMLLHYHGEFGEEDLRRQSRTMANMIRIPGVTWRVMHNISGATLCYDEVMTQHVEMLRAHQPYVECCAFVGGSLSQARYLHDVMGMLCAGRVGTTQVFDQERDALRWLAATPAR